jgi:hypothetical protein
VKHNITVILIGLLLLSAIGATAQIPIIQKSIDTNPIKPTPELTNLADELIDQAQLDYDSDLSFGAVLKEYQLNQSIAQSFIPQTQVLTRIQIYLSRNITSTYPCTLTLVRNLTDDPLATVTILPENINIFNNYSWIEFDFDDIEITANITHHLILTSENITDNLYFCGANTSNAYENGTAHIRSSEIDAWEPLINTDLCFMIYGYYLPDMEIGFVGGFGLTVCFTNYGLGDAHNLNYDIIIKGGFYNMIDIDEHGAYGTIPAGGEETVEIPIFGLGWVNITAKLNDQYEYGQGIVLLIFIF